MAISSDAKVDLITGVVITVLAASSAPCWWKYVDRSSISGSSSEIPGMVGGCEPFQLFAQNRWDPVGATIRVQPNILSNENGSFAPNRSISANGWVHGRVAYPTNPPPWNDDV